MPEPLTGLERELVMRQLIVNCRATSQSISDCVRRGPEMSDQLKVARAKESGLLKVMSMIGIEQKGVPFSAKAPADNQEAKL